MPVSKKTSLIAPPVLITFALLFYFVSFDIKWHFDGIFVLKNNEGKYVVKDDLYVGDTEQLVYAIDFDDPKFRIENSLQQHKPGESHLYYEWDETDGSGFVKNFMADGTVLFTSFGRLYDETKERIHGLFVGGTLPANILKNTNFAMNESGMSYYDGKNWHHIWCNVNEAIFAYDGRGVRFPSSWIFIGSKVIDKSNQSLVLASYHKTDNEGVPIYIERIVYLFANEPYFILTINFKNMGSTPTSFNYEYGDEPWLGLYGTSRGSVGWVKDRIINYETALSAKEYSYAGMYHYGNDLINEGHDFTNLANFIEWFGVNLPSRFYFSDRSGLLTDPTGKNRIPLKSNERFIDVVWLVKDLLPQQTYTVNIAVGMAGYDPKSKMPIKPSIRKSFNR